MNTPKAIVIHYDEREVFTDQDLKLIERLGLKPDDFVNVVLLCWSVYQDKADRIYEVIIEEVAEMVMDDTYTTMGLDTLSKCDDAVVELTTRIHGYLFRSLRDLPDQFFHAVQSGLMDNYETGYMTVVSHDFHRKTMLLSMS